jgi:hypothetical protein
MMRVIHSIKFSEGNRRVAAVYTLHAFHKKTQVGRQNMSKPESYASVWDAIADTPVTEALVRIHFTLNFDTRPAI